jgi:hypothetical protein
VEVLIFALIFWIVPTFVGHAIGKPKNRHGGWWGFFLGWIGVIVVAILPARPGMTLQELERQKGVVSPKWYDQKRTELIAAQTHRECPHCKEQMRRDASVCPHCQRDSDAWRLYEGRWWAQVGGTWYWLDELSQTWHPAAAETAVADQASGETTT